MTTEKWTDAQIALTDIEEVFFRREKFLDTRHIELLRNLDRAVSESGEYCDRLIFKDGTSLALITQRKSPYLYGRWEIVGEWVATEEDRTIDAISRRELELAKAFQLVGEEIRQIVDDFKATTIRASAEIESILQKYRGKADQPEEAMSNVIALDQVTLDHPVKPGDDLALLVPISSAIQAGSTLLFSIDGKAVKIVTDLYAPVGWRGVRIETCKGDLEIPAQSVALVFPPGSAVPDGD